MSASYPPSYVGTTDVDLWSTSFYLTTGCGEAGHQSYDEAILELASLLAPHVHAPSSSRSESPTKTSTQRKQILFSNNISEHPREES
jgi:hypothetical protein